MKDAYVPVTKDNCVKPQPDKPHPPPKNARLPLSPATEPDYPPINKATKLLPDLLLFWSVPATAPA
ncbi:MAG: hypothetical protein AB7T15_10920, partial [Desulfuromonas sp.]